MEHNLPSFEEIQRVPDKETPYVFSIFTPDVKGSFRMLKMGTMALSDGQMECRNDKAKQEGMKHFNELPLIEMNFVMAGTLQQKLGYLPQPMTFTRGYHNIMYNIGEWEHNKFMGDGGHNTFTVNIHADRFVQLFSAYSAEMDHMTDKVLANHPFLYHQPKLPFTPQMIAIIQSLWNCRLTGGLRSLFMEVKMQELLLMQWEMFTQPPPSTTKADVDKMHMAKEILLKDICNPPSLAQLARLCGINEFKLKKEFKEVFNDTVFGYFNAVRLEQSRQLILDTNKTMSEIAYETGYAHPQHFSRAFKKKFGVTPGEVKRT
jgi:AraC family transcriptional activator of pyochelin receptor